MSLDRVARQRFERLADQAGRLCQSWRLLLIPLTILTFLVCARPEGLTKTAGTWEMGFVGMLLWVVWQIVKFVAIVVAVALGIALSRA